MKQEYISRHAGADRLILIFAGWSTEARFYADVSREGWDVMVCYDYRDLSFDSDMLSGYSTIYLYAWSLGVFVANRVLQNVNLTKAFAINGTLRPVDDLNGIPVSIYRGTADTLSERNLIKFRLRMFGGRDVLEANATRLPEHDDIESLQEELRAIEANSLDESGDSIPWTRVYISSEDRIFPPANMKNAWHGHSDTVVLNGASHYVDIPSIVRDTIPDISGNARRFHRSMNTYDDHAVAQKQVAENLGRLIAERFSCENCRLLEIGQGTGILTNILKTSMKPAKAVFVDLYETPRFGVAPQEEYIIGDAEVFVERCGANCFDAIVSASAIQWFVNLPRFISNAAKTLNPSGIFACSSFLPGNLRELDGVRVPLPYPSKEQLAEWMAESFDEFEIIEDEIKLEFNTVREALLHISRTGVGGTASHNTLSTLSSAIPSTPSGTYTLTFRPVYIIGSKL